MHDLNMARSAAQPRAASGGFTILELALTLAILGVLAAGVLVPFVAQVAQRNVSNTERTLAEAKEALLGYATATGRLPCPATDTSNGQESPANASATGACTTFYGFLPAATLGLTPVDAQGYALDGWATPPQNRIRYAVSDHNGANTFTRAGGMRSVGPSALADTPLLYVCGSGNGVVTGANPDCGTAVMLTDRAPVVLWSVGANALSGGRNADEAQNPHPNGSASPPFGTADRIFVSRGMSSVAGAEFDDIVTWLSVGNLVSRMVLGGQLP